MSDIDDIMNDIIAAVRPVIERRLASINAAAERAALANVRTRFSALFDGEEASAPVVSSSHTVEPDRAMPGTVKPALRQLVLEHADEGLTVKEIVGATGFKFNTVRGTLWSLAKDQVIELIGGRYFPKSTTPKG